MPARVCALCVCERRREVDRARTSARVRSCESESVASMWITRVRVRDPLSLVASLASPASLRRPAPLACLSLSAVPYLWPFPYDALGSELRRAPIYATSEGTAPILDRFTFEQARWERREKENFIAIARILRKTFYIPLCALLHAIAVIGICSRLDTLM